MSLLHRYSMPWDRNNGCSWADRFYSQTLVEANGGSVTGSPTFDPTGGVTLDGSNDHLTYTLTGHEFNSASFSILIEFTPDFAADNDSTNYLIDADIAASGTGRYYISHLNDASANVLTIVFGGTGIANIPLVDYQAYWVTGGRNTLVVSGTTGDTSAWLNGTKILDADSTAWTPTAPTRLNVGARYSNNVRWDGIIHRLQVFKSQLSDVACEQLSLGTYQGSVIQELINEGALQLYHDYRRGNSTDLSGNSNDGTPTAGCCYSREGIHFPGTDDRVQVTDTAGLLLTEGALVVLGDFIVQGAVSTYNVMIDKYSGVNKNYRFYLNQNLGLVVDTSGGSSSIASTFAGSKMLAANFENNVKPDFYVDGVYIGQGTAARACATAAADVSIGNSLAGGVIPRCPYTLAAALIINRPLTAAEHFRLYQELRYTKGY